MAGTFDPVVSVVEAKQAAVPLIVVDTPDESAFVVRLREAWAGEYPLVSWDCFRGVVPLSDAGKVWTDQAGEVEGIPLADFFRLIMSGERGLPLRSVVIVHLAHRTAFDDAGTVQAICLLRDHCKARGQTILLMASGGAKVPAEFARDVLSVSDALPDEAEILRCGEEIAEAVAVKRDVETADDETKAGAVAALVGLPRFSIEQAYSLVLRSRGKLDLDELWKHKAAMIRAIPGLKLESGGADLSSLGGLHAICTFARSVFLGRDAPAIVVRLDDWDKVVGSAGSESSGTTQRAVGTILTSMEDLGWGGVIATGVPGCGKSWFSRCAASTFKRRTIAFDLSACFDKYVGNSEAAVRAVVDLLWAIAGRRVFFIASCNRPEAISTELKRRFRGGIWFFDAPDHGEREAIWRIQLQAFGLPLDSARPVDLNWTGAEIRNCCEWAYRLSVPLTEAAQYIVPVLAADPEWIDRLRRQASGAFLSASVPGAYKIVSPSLDVPVTGGRSF